MKSSTTFKKGHKVPIEWREKLSKKMKGKPVWNKGVPGTGGHNKTSFKKGQVPWNKDKKGIHLSPNSEFRKGKVCGENSKHWKGGKMIYWKKKAKERDMGICQECRLHEPDIMEVDHIIPVWKFPEGKFLLSNLRTICPNCHARKSQRERREFHTSKSR